MHNIKLDAPEPPLNQAAICLKLSDHGQRWSSVVSNITYWIGKSGADYRRQQEKRRVSYNNFTYHLQEAWLRFFFEKLASDRGSASLKVLDFGCGFGRIANILCGINGLEYYGYDISTSMTEEFRSKPPKQLENSFDQRVRIADSLTEAYPQEHKFDFILTVSVLIHNSHENVRRILSSMLDRLGPGGQLVLIENLHTAISAFENFWHGGCWCHSFVRNFDRLADVEIFDNLAGQHAVYLVTPHREDGSSRYVYHADPEQEGEEVGFDTILLRGLNRAVVNSDHLAAETAAFGQDSGDLIGRIHDLSENLSYATEETSQLKQKLAASQDAIVRAREDASQAKERFAERQRLFEDLAAVTNEERLTSFQRTQPEQPDAYHSHSAETIKWNAHQDVVYSHGHAGFDKVLHVFQQEWFGIRAAAGSLPGQKLAIAAKGELQDDSLIAIYDRIEKESFSRIIFHGLSRNSAKLISLLARKGLSEHLYVLKHGSTAQWSSDAEREMAYKAIELLDANQIRKLHFMKAGFSYPHDGIYAPILFNLSPRFDNGSPLHAAQALRLDGVVLSPGWSGWIKNVYINVLAAALSECVNSIWLYAHSVELPTLLMNKLVKKNYTSREETFQMMAMSSLCLNVSLIDCHPMVNIESQTLGRPCLRGPLFLDALDDHPYVALTTVNNVNSIAEIRERIDAVLAMPADEREALTRDYQRQSDAVAFDRYADFLEL